MKNFLKNIIFLSFLLMMVSCSTMHTVISKRNLDVQTKMSDTIWLEPAAANQKTVFVKISNTSGKNLNIEQKIVNTLSAKGYRIVNDPAEAKYWLQANILKVDKVNLDKVRCWNWGSIRCSTFRWSLYCTWLGISWSCNRNISRCFS